MDVDKIKTDTKNKQGFKKGKRTNKTDRQTTSPDW